MSKEETTLKIVENAKKRAEKAVANYKNKVEKSRKHLFHNILREYTVPKMNDNKYAKVHHSGKHKNEIMTTEAISSEQWSKYYRIVKKPSAWKKVTPPKKSDSVKKNSKSQIKSTASAKSSLSSESSPSTSSKSSVQEPHFVKGKLHQPNDSAIKSSSSGTTFSDETKNMEREALGK